MIYDLVGTQVKADAANFCTQHMARPAEAMLQCRIFPLISTIAVDTQVKQRNLQHTHDVQGTALLHQQYIVRR